MLTPRRMLLDSGRSLERLIIVIMPLIAADFFRIFIVHIPFPSRGSTISFFWLAFFWLAFFPRTFLEDQIHPGQDGRQHAREPEDREEEYDENVSRYIGSLNQPDYFARCHVCDRSAGQKDPQHNQGQEDSIELVCHCYHVLSLRNQGFVACISNSNSILPSN